MNTNEYELRFRQWLAEHTGLLLKVVRSFADRPSDVDDLFQEVLLQVWMSMPAFRSESKPTTWLYRVALNTALAWKRKESRHRQRRQPLLEASATTDGSTGPAEAGQQRETVDRLYVAVRTLPPMKRAIVLLYLDGLSYREMADVTGISENNVGVHLNRSKNYLAAALKEANRVP